MAQMNGGVVPICVGAARMPCLALSGPTIDHSLGPREAPLLAWLEILAVARLPTGGAYKAVCCKRPLANAD